MRRAERSLSGRDDSSQPPLPAAHATARLAFDLSPQRLEHCNKAFWWGLAPCPRVALPGVHAVQPAQFSESRATELKLSILGNHRYDCSLPDCVRVYDRGGENRGGLRRTNRLPSDLLDLWPYPAWAPQEVFDDRPASFHSAHYP